MPRAPNNDAILYVASRLPELSETFVYRELLGLRSRGRTVIGASIRPPRHPVDDAELARLADEAIIAYGARGGIALPVAVLRHPIIFGRALLDAMRADHADAKSRLKHAFQAGMGISLGWRLRRRGIAHIHAHMANTPTMVALYAARTLGARFSFTGHAADLFVQRDALRFKLEQANFVSSISYWHQDLYQKLADIVPDKTPLIRCSVALPADTTGAGCEVVTVARLVPKKGIDLLIRAFARATLHGWTLRILGDGPERAALERLVGDLGIRNAVRFEGAKPHNACLTAIAGAGMFVLPCRTAANGDRDGIPVVLMEAMAASRPVIGGDIPTIRELVADGETGLLVPSDDEQALATAMLRLATDPTLGRRLGAAARDWIAREFSDEVNLDRLSAALDRAGAGA